MELLERNRFSPFNESLFNRSLGLADAVSFPEALAPSSQVQVLREAEVAPKGVGERSLLETLLEKKYEQPRDPRDSFSRVFLMTSIFLI